MHSQIEGEACRPRAYQPSREEVRVVLIISFCWSHRRRNACSRISCPLSPFVCSDSDGQRPRDLQLQTSCISKLPLRQSLHQPVSQSVCQLLHHLVNIKIPSEVLMPTGYLSGLAHAFIYKFSLSCGGEGSNWIVTSVSGAIISTFHSDFLHGSSYWGES